MSTHEPPSDPSKDGIKIIDDKRWLQISHEDYEGGLAIKVINKAYSLLLLPLIGITGTAFGLLTYFGFTYKNNVSEASSNLEKKLIRIDSLEQRYLRRLFEYDIKKEIQEKETDILDKYYGNMNEAYLGFTNTLFQSYHDASYKNIATLHDIEVTIGDKMHNALDSVQSIREEVQSVNDSIYKAQQQINNIITPMYIQKLKDERDSLIKSHTEFIQLYSPESFSIQKGRTHFSYILQAPIYYDKNKNFLTIMGTRFTNESEPPILLKEKFNIDWWDDESTQKIGTNTIHLSISIKKE